MCFEEDCSGLVHYNVYEGTKSEITTRTGGVLYEFYERNFPVL
jgi:hypothetical protein